MALTKIPSSLLDTSGGLDLQGNITLGDNEQIQLGDSTDLAIYHDGSHSYIKDTGTGNLFIDATSLRFRTGAGTENYLVAEGNGAVNLYYDNSKKFETTSTGATVTGTLTVTGDLDITGNVNSASVTDLDVTDKTITLGAGQTEALSGGSGIIVDGSLASILWDETNDTFDINKGLSVTGQAEFANKLKVYAENNAVVAVDSLSNAYMVIDRSADNRRGALVFSTAAADVFTAPPATGTINWALGVSDSDELSGNKFAIKAGNTNFSSAEFVIDTSGNVGIGTDSPKAKLNTNLEVEGSILAYMSGTSLTFDGGNNIAVTHSSSALGTGTAAGLLLANNNNTNGAASPLIAFSARSASLSYNHTYATIHGEKTSSGADSNWNRGALIFSTSSNTGPNERMRIDKDGNVGIGTSNPGTLLTVGDGTGTEYITIDKSTTGESGILFKNAGNNKGKILLDSNENLQFYVNNTTNAMTILESGNVGISYTTPYSRLWVEDEGINLDDFSFEDASSIAHLTLAGSNAHVRMHLGTMDVSPYGVYIQGGFDNTPDASGTGNSGVEPLLLNPLGGNVGIGTKNPADNILHIETTASGGPQIQIGDGTNYGFINFDGTSMQLSTQRDMVDGTWYNTAKSWGGINIIGESIGSKITMTTAPNANTSPTTHFLLDRDGHLILGSSTTAAGKLSVYTDATNDPAIYGYRSTSEFKIVPFLSNGAFSSLSSVNDSGLFFSDNFVIAKHATGDYGMKVFGNGNIAFGTGTAQSKYTFQGDTTGDIITVKSGNNTNTNVGMIIFRDSGNTYCGQITANGSTHTTAYLTSSDYRLKENVTYEFNALDRVAQLKPARFNWISDETNTLVDGFLAHEVSDIVPEAINGEKDATKEEEYEITPADYEDDGETLISEAVMGTRTVPVYQGIDQSKLVPLLTKAIQELKTELDAAKARITELEG